MAKREVKTDLWVYDLLKEAGICLDPQGCSIKEVDEALKTASKKGTGNVGYILNSPNLIGRFTRLGLASSSNIQL